MKPGSAIINTASVNSDMPSPISPMQHQKAPFKISRAAWRRCWRRKATGLIAVAPGPIWTLLIFDDAGGRRFC
jgi:hypothetical protein